MKTSGHSWRKRTLFKSRYKDVRLCRKLTSEGGIQRKI
jgi:hypothetical protein